MTSDKLQNKFGQFAALACVNTMPRTDFSSELRKAVIAAHKCGQGYEAISK